MPYKDLLRRKEYCKNYAKNNREKVRRARMRSYYKNREKELSRQAEYQKKNRIKVTAYLLRWQKANPDKVKEYSRRTYVKNRERILTYGKMWQKKNRKRQNAYMRANRNRWIKSILHNNSLRKYRIRGATGSHTLLEWESLKVLHKGRCVICKKLRKLTRDHIVPITKGGTNNISNIQPLCSSCNSKKGNRL